MSPISALLGERRDQEGLIHIQNDALFTGAGLCMRHFLGSFQVLTQPPAASGPERERGQKSRAAGLLLLWSRVRPDQLFLLSFGLDQKAVKTQSKGPKKGASAGQLKSLPRRTFPLSQTTASQRSSPSNPS